MRKERFLVTALAASFLLIFGCGGGGGGGGLNVGSETTLPTTPVQTGGATANAPVESGGPASPVEAVPPVSASSSPAGTAAQGGSATVPSNTAILSWDAPTSRVDGSPLTDLAGYKVYYGTTSGSYERTVDVGNVTNFTVENLSAGTYFFTVTSYDSRGIESAYAGEVNKTL